MPFGDGEVERVSLDLDPEGEPFKTWSFLDALERSECLDLDEPFDEDGDGVPLGTDLEEGEGLLEVLVSCAIRVHFPGIVKKDLMSLSEFLV